MVSHAVAKINLILRVIGQQLRPGTCGRNHIGYHKIESIFVFLNGMYDTLELDTATTVSESSGSIDGVPITDNSIQAAAKILIDNFDRVVPDVRITKRLPISGGVGGGSSDAACFINAVFNLWGMPLLEKLRYIDLFDALGSDTKIFLYKYFGGYDSLYVLGTGLDDVPVTVPSPVCGYVVLVNNGTRLSAMAVYDAFAGPYCNEIGIDGVMNLLSCNERNRPALAHNSLMQAAITLNPSIRAILSSIEITAPTLYGLSGSGPTCFGIYSSLAAAQSASYLLDGTSHVLQLSDGYPAG
jgi:4-diphosphocytidyl-2-C-methyl-D-erythritol kinase